MLSSLNAVILTNESTRFITGRVIYNPAYTYKFQLKATIEKEARLMYDGMSNVLSSSHLLEDVSLYEIEPGVCGYTFTVPLNPEEPTTLSWTMNDDWFKGLLYFTF